LNIKSELISINNELMSTNKNKNIDIYVNKYSSFLKLFKLKTEKVINNNDNNNINNNDDNNKNDNKDKDDNKDKNNNKSKHITYNELIEIHKHISIIKGEIEDLNKQFKEFKSKSKY
jgi:hypothetical protein